MACPKSKEVSFDIGEESLGEYKWSYTLLGDRINENKYNVSIVFIPIKGPVKNNATISDCLIGSKEDVTKQAKEIIKYWPKIRIQIQEFLGDEFDVPETSPENRNLVLFD